MFSFDFLCKQYGTAYPTVHQKELVITPDILKGVTAHETYIVRVYRGDSCIYQGPECEIALQRFIDKFNRNSCKQRSSQSSPACSAPSSQPTPE